MTTVQGIFQRAELLVGSDAMTAIASARVIIFGVGGVGSWCAESLVRSGITHLTMVDPDLVAESNINRQLPATTLTIGQPKVEVLRERLLQINPSAQIQVIQGFYTPENRDSFHLDQYDYVVDAIDSLKDKVDLILTASAIRTLTIYSSMGAALKMDPTRIHVAEFWDVKGCPLARALRQRFKRDRHFPARKFRCVYSDELLANREQTDETCSYKAQINGTIAHVTAIFGFTLAGLLIQDICERQSSHL